MRTSEIWTEAWRNLRSGTSKALALCLLAALVTSALAWLDLTSITSVLNEAATYRQIGASTLVAEAGNRIDGSACERLSSLPGVSGAGAIRMLQKKARLSTMPQQGVPVIEVTPGMAAVLGVDTKSAGLWVSSSTKKSLGLEVGDQVVVDGAATSIAGTYDYPSDGRQPGLDYAFLEPVATSAPFDQCWVTQWPTDPTMRSLLNTVINPGNTQDKTTIGQLNPTKGSTFDGLTRFEKRPSRWVAAGAALAGLLIMLIVFLLRRVELASALHAGVRRSDLHKVALAETLVCALIAIILTAPITISLVSRGGTALVVFALQPLVALVWGMLTGTTLAVILIRERHLFDYFKSR